MTFQTCDTPEELSRQIQAGAKAIRRTYGHRRVTHLADFAEDVAEVVLRAVRDLDTEEEEQ